MAQEAMSIFDLSPSIHLEMMKPNQSINNIARALFDHLPAVIAEAKPDALLVQGDTTTAAMSSLCALQSKAPVGHIEDCHCRRESFTARRASRD
jgi:UDP-N-acetylglucosamine 2-epimerase (non-hydrolysing)